MEYRSSAVLALATAATLAVAGCGGSSTKTQTVDLTEPGGNAGTFGLIGKPTQNKIPTGSGFAFATPLVNGSKQSVGALHAVCIATSPSAGNTINGTCTATADVPGGTLGLNAGGRVGGSVSGAITGGTGKYARATGTFSSVQTGGSNGPNHDTFKITLPS